MRLIQKPLPDISLLDPAKYEWNNDPRSKEPEHPIRSIQRRNIGFWEVIAALEFPDGITVSKSASHTNCYYRGDVRVVLYEPKKRIVSVYSTIGADERTPLAPPIPGMKLGELLSDAQREKLVAAAKGKPKVAKTLTAEEIHEQLWDCLHRHILALEPGAVFTTAELTTLPELAAIPFGDKLAVSRRIGALVSSAFFTRYVFRTDLGDKLWRRNDKTAADYAPRNPLRPKGANLSNAGMCTRDYIARLVAAGCYGHDVVGNDIIMEYPELIGLYEGSNRAMNNVISALQNSHTRGELAKGERAGSYFIPEPAKAPVSKKTKQREPEQLPIPEAPAVESVDVLPELEPATPPVTEPEPEKAVALVADKPEESAPMLPVQRQQQPVEGELLPAIPEQPQPRHVDAAASLAAAIIMSGKGEVTFANGRLQLALDVTGEQ